MKRIALSLAFLTIVCCTDVYAGIDGSVFLYPVDTSFHSWGQAAWYSSFGNYDAEAQLDGTHSVTSGSTTVASDSFSVTGSYSGDVQGAAQPGVCYGSTLQVTANRGWFGSTSATFSGGSSCAPPPDPEPDKGLPTDNPECPHSPIVIALNERYEFTSTERGVQFDIDADGDADRVAWPSDGSVAFLFYDRNGNGLPDDGSELFGDHTRLRNGAKARHGFEALAEFDSDRDGSVSAADAQWAQLRLWQDADHNGVATQNEISTLGASGISALGLGFHWTGRRDAHGNILRWQSSVARTGSSGPRPYYDVYLMTRVSS